MSTFFNGSYLVTPDVVSAIDDSLMYPAGLPSGNVLALIGECSGGKPKTALRIRSPLHAQRMLRSGPLLDAAIRAFAPASIAGSPAAVLAVRVDPATQSTASLKGSGAVDVIDLRSTDYGAHTSGLEIRLETGTRVGFRVSVRQDGVVFFRDNIGLDCINVQYTGAAITATVKVEAGNLILEAPTGTAVKTYILQEWSTVAALVEAITASMTDWEVTAERGAERFRPERMDKVTITDAKTAAGVLTGNAWSIVHYINSNSEIFLDATFADTAPVLSPVTCAWTPLVGGVNGNNLPVDWEEAFDALHEVEAHWLVPLTDNPAIWDMAAAHCDYLSARKRERRAFVGGDTGVTEAQAKADAYGINSDRVGYVWPGVYEYDVMTRELTLKPAYLAAVNVAAAFACLNPGTTMSRKAISVAAAEVLLKEPTDTDDLILSGVLALVQNESGIIVSQAVSTWQMDDRYNRREVSVGAAVDYVARTVRKALEPLLGDRASPEVLPRARSRMTSVLDDLTVSPPNGPGVLVGTAESPSYRNISLEIEGDVMRVAFECSPVIPINYVLIGISVSPWRGTLITN